MTHTEHHDTLQKWHHAVAHRDMSVLDDLLADDCVLHSPVLHTPQRGKPIVTMYLQAASVAIANDAFRYIREVVSGDDIILEFETTYGDIYINGVDMIRCRADGKIVDFKVMLRPKKAVELVHENMMRALSALKGGTLPK
ncbi:MAG: nuclear transport factor 2 family protein [Myxococcota bacterium]